MNTEATSVPAPVIKPPVKPARKLSRLMNNPDQAKWEKVSLIAVWILYLFGWVVLFAPIWKLGSMNGTGLIWGKTGFTTFEMFFSLFEGLEMRSPVFTLLCVFGMLPVILMLIAVPIAFGQRSSQPRPYSLTSLGMIGTAILSPISVQFVNRMACGSNANDFVEPQTVFGLWPTIVAFVLIGAGGVLAFFVQQSFIVKPPIDSLKVRAATRRRRNILTWISRGLFAVITVFMFLPAFEKGSNTFELIPNIKEGFMGGKKAESVFDLFSGQLKTFFTFKSFGSALLALLLALFILTAVAAPLLALLTTFLPSARKRPRPLFAATVLSSVSLAVLAIISNYFANFTEATKPIWAYYIMMLLLIGVIACTAAVKGEQSFSLEGQRARAGYIFALPFIIGFFAFLLYPLIINLILSLGKMAEGATGFMTDFIGFGNYTYLFTVDIDFLPAFYSTLKSTFLWTPFILVFALFMAILLNRKIKFKGFFRVVFFMPVLLGTGYIMKQLTGAASILSLPDALKEFIKYYFSTDAASFFSDLLSEIMSVFWKTGVQIVIFLSALQSIPDSYYEAAKVDNANGWDCFWKITLPMISPTILLNAVYTIIENFSSTDNAIANLIVNTVFKEANFEYAAAMGWIYFVVVLIIVGLVFLLSRKVIRYEK